MNRCNCGRFIGNDDTLCSQCETENENSQFEELDESSSDSQVKLEKAGNDAVGTIITKNQPKTLDEMIELFDIDLSIWFAERSQINSWDVTNKAGITFTNYQVKIFFKRDQVAWSYDKIREDFLDAVKDYAPKHKKIAYKKVKEKNILEINISDLHIGKLAWNEETKDGNYDTKIATKRFVDTLEKTIARASVFDYERIVFPIGNDFFNSDNIFGTTTGGTAQDVDVRWQKSYRMGRELLINAIDYLKQYAPVDVIVVQGNHDEERMFYVGDALDLFYTNCDSVTVDNSASLRKYYKFGKVLLGFTHGAKEKQADLPLIMANECPKEWAETSFRELHLGHLHHRREIKYLSTQEYKGVVVRLMRSLTSADAWHASKGFIGSVKGSEAFIWNYDTGLIAMMEFNLI
jgi:hypothetical protein